ncbi:MAG: AbrB/MazE/SpoVT family DNA-binding domain-containing protein [Pseudomonadota bacterium]
MLEFRTQVKEGGRIVLPSQIRKKLHIDIGEELLLKVEDNEIHVMTYTSVIENAQSVTRKYNKSKQKLTDLLYEMRQEEMDD